MSEAQKHAQELLRGYREILVGARSDGRDLDREPAVAEALALIGQEIDGVDATLNAIGQA